MAQARLTRRMLLQGGVSLAVVGCMDRPDAPVRAALRPLTLSADRLVKITVCTRPFRPAGPRLEVEAVGETQIVHSYGHGGSGWSLAWGSAEDAAALALASSPASVGVVGAGAIGLTTATVLREAGVPVTIYAKEFPLEARSARATGTWSPDSRIAMRADAPADFADTWESLARRSYARHQHYVGMAGQPVEYTPRFNLRDEPRRPPSERPDPSEEDFLHMRRRIRDMEPGWGDIPEAERPFSREGVVRGGLTMTFNVTEYSRRLMTDFLTMGGDMRRAAFAAPAEIAALPHPVVVNCTGYGAKTLWQDESLVPVRGQIGWLAPQADRLYGVTYQNTIALSRRDGVLIQHFGENEYYGYGDDTETPDRAEFEMALSLVGLAFGSGAQDEAA